MRAAFERTRTAYTKRSSPTHLCRFETISISFAFCHSSASTSSQGRSEEGERAENRHLKNETHALCIQN